MTKRARVLVVTAHPDDESWMAGSTIRRLTLAGHRVFVLALTAGDNAWLVRIGHASRTAMQRLRRRELKAACRTLGVSACQLLGFQDGRLRQTPSSRLARSIETALRRWRPDLILTFAEDGISGHGDHLAVLPAVKTALAKGKSPVPVLEFTYPSRIKRWFGFSSRRQPRLIKIRTTPASRQAKLRAIEIHASQPKTVERLHALNAAQRRAFFEFEYIVATSPAASVRSEVLS